MNAQFYTLQQVADMLGVTKKTLYRWNANGSLAFTRIGKRWKIAHADYERFIARHTGKRNPGC